MPITQESEGKRSRLDDIIAEMEQREAEAERRAFAVRQKYDAIQGFAEDTKRGMDISQAAAKALGRIAATQNIPKPMTEGESKRLQLQQQRNDFLSGPKVQQPKIMSTKEGAVIQINPDFSLKELRPATPPQPNKFDYLKAKEKP